ncbi:hypothetical protein V6N13_042893 [Hibiscus sabdariffa]
MVRKNASRKGSCLSPAELVYRISESLDAYGEGGSSCIRMELLESDLHSLMEHSLEDDKHSLADSYPEDMIEGVESGKRGSQPSRSD